MNKKISIGLDFGTLSVRAIALCLETGEIVSSYISEYKDGAIEKKIPKTNISLPLKWALQNPFNYIESMEEVLEKVVNEIRNDFKIVSIGTDFTSSTVIPLNKNFDPLIVDDILYENPHAWPKLWKHHAAQSQATRINDLALESNEKWIKYYGGKISAEWLFPKALQILEDDNELYDKIYTFIEAGDWITYKLTGEEKRSNTMAGFKAMYAEEKFPSSNFLKKLHPQFGNFIKEKLNENYYLPTEKAGNLSREYLKKLQLDYEIPVSVSIIDAHAAIGSIPKIEDGVIVN